VLIEKRRKKDLVLGKKKTPKERGKKKQERVYGRSYVKGLSFRKRGGE